MAGKPYGQGSLTAGQKDPAAIECERVCSVSCPSHESVVSSHSRDLACAKRSLANGFPADGFLAQRASLH